MSNETAPSIISIASSRFMFSRNEMKRRISENVFSSYLARQTEKASPYDVFSLRLNRHSRHRFPNASRPVLRTQRLNSFGKIEWFGNDKPAQLRLVQG